MIFDGGDDCNAAKQQGCLWNEALDPVLTTVEQARNPRGPVVTRSTDAQTGPYAKSPTWAGGLRRRGGGGGVWGRKQYTCQDG